MSSRAAADSPTKSSENALTMCLQVQACMRRRVILTRIYEKPRTALASLKRLRAQLCISRGWSVFPSASTVRVPASIHLRKSVCITGIMGESIHCQRKRKWGSQIENGRRGVHWDSMTMSSSLSWLNEGRLSSLAQLLRVLNQPTVSP